MSVNTHLATVFQKNYWSTVRITEITKALQSEVALAGLKVGLNLNYFREISMHAGRYMILIPARVDTDTIRIVIRLISDTMM